MCLNGLLVCVCVHRPVPDPARVTVGALSVDVVTEVTVLARRAGVLTAVPKEPRKAPLVTLGAVPAGLTGDTAPLRHLAGLLALTVTTPGGGTDGTAVTPSNPSDNTRFAQNRT